MSLPIGWWELGWQELIYLVTGFTSLFKATDYYRRWFRIESLFSDYKTRGFRLEQNHLVDPQRLAHLLIGSALAYWWLTYLRVEARAKNYDQVIFYP